MSRPHRTSGLLAAACMLALAGICHAQTRNTPFVPTPLEPGVIRDWGDDAMRGTLAAWERGFRAYHPEISFEDKLMGTATSMAGIITGTSDLSLMGRPVTANEVIGFEWVFRVKPLGIQVANGSLRTEGSTPALAVFVSRGNPLRQIGMAQLASILGCPADARQPVTWALAGAEGPWKNKPVHAYLYDDQTGTGAFLQQAIQGKKDCWNWNIVREFKDAKRAGGSTYPAAQQIAEALEHDPDGLAISTLSYAAPSIKALPVGTSGRATPLTRATVVDGTYPLARGVYVYLHRAADRPIDPKVKEFLRFILSDEGQALVERQGDLLPLDRTLAAQQAHKLE